ncbi:MAG: tetratricopeptide repeat protein, partial [Phycisphaerales bacterium]|nr:tetratricopeptide repeat protein [Phycisphaerales bacterium]
AYLYEDLGRLADAESLYRKTIELQRAQSGGLDPETWAVLNNLAMLLVNDGRAEEARPLFEELLELCAASLPADHYYTAIFKTNLALCLTDLEHYDEAQALLLEAHPILEAALGAEHPRTITTVERLVDAYERGGQSRRADRWRNRLVASGP